MQVKINNRRVKISGKFVSIKANQDLLFEVSGAYFPYGVSIFTRLAVSSILDNEVTINYGDGNVIVYPFINGRFDIRPNDLGNYREHHYTDGYTGRRNIRVMFKYPLRVTGVQTSTFIIYGAFPRAIVNLTNIESITVGQSSITSFPEDLSRLTELRTLILQSIGTAISERIPSSFLSLKLHYLNLNNSTNLSDVYASNFYALCDSVLGQGLRELRITGCNMGAAPQNLGSLSSLTTFYVSSSLNTIPIEINNILSLKTLHLRMPTSSLVHYSSFSNLINITSIEIQGMMETVVPIGIENCINLKTLSLSDFNTVFRVNEFIDNFYVFITTNASMVSGNSKFRQMLITTTYEDRGNPSGIYQQPIGYIQGSNNGNPASQLEKIWVLVNQYQTTWTY